MVSAAGPLFYTTLRGTTVRTVSKEAFLSRLSYLKQLGFVAEEEVVMPPTIPEHDELIIPPLEPADEEFGIFATPAQLRKMLGYVPPFSAHCLFSCSEPMTMQIVISV